MFSHSNTQASGSKCLFTQAILPPLLERNVAPPKRRPFSTFFSQPFSYKIDLILPGEHCDSARRKFASGAGTLRYARVKLALLEIIQGDFFNQYIKSGDVLLLSEGRPSVDNVFSFRDGILTLQIDKPTYERCGLVGKPIPDGGRKHAKSRYEITYNLRLPSMVHGKKGFERLTWACKNVLSEPLTWLFYDTLGTDLATGPISKFHPRYKSVDAEVLHTSNASVPDMALSGTVLDPLHAEEMHEWLALAALESPRIKSGDDVDSFICRYRIPETSRLGDSDNAVTTRHIVKLSWQGFIPAKFVAELWLLARSAVGNDWLAINVCAIGGGGYTVLGVDEQETLTWICS